MGLMEGLDNSVVTGRLDRAVAWARKFSLLGLRGFVWVENCISG